jgi:ABC-2 type transport system ATP-binding protein
MTSKQAISVNNVYKKFGKPGDPIWKQLLKSKTTTNGNATKNGSNVENSNGKANGNGRIKGNKNGKKEVIAVNRVSFNVREGEIFGVLGPNGSGKSTLIRLMATLLLPDEGDLKVFNYDVVAEPIKVQKLINRVSVEASFFKKLSPMENLMYGARLYGMSGGETKKQVVEILTRLGLEERSIFNPMEEMSRGMQQKVAIARALLTKPKVLLLDEPTTGLDPRSKREVQAVIEELRDEHGTTMLLTTHDMVEADILCDRVAILDKGDVVALDTPENLKKMVPNNNGHETTLEDVFLALTGRKLKDEDEDK